MEWNAPPPMKCSASEGPSGVLGKDKTGPLSPSAPGPARGTSCWNSLRDCRVVIAPASKLGFPGWLVRKSGDYASLRFSLWMKWRDPQASLEGVDRSRASREVAGPNREVVPTASGIEYGDLAGALHPDNLVFIAI